MKNSVSSVNQVKDNNTKLILNALKGLSSGTKNTVSQITGLSIATCNTSLNELAKAKRVLEVQGEYSMAGRPPKAYQFNANYSHICCLYVTHEEPQHSIHYAIVDLLGHVLKTDSVDSNYINGDTIISVIESLISEDPLISQISVGLPGCPHDGQFQSVFIPGLIGYPLKQKLSEHFKMDVYCDNDMNVIALGLFKKFFPNADDPFSVIAFFKGQGPGAGSIVHQEIVKGMSNFAGEVHYLYANDPKFWYDISSHYEEAVQKAFLIILSFITIINPKTIVLIGKNASGNMVDDLKKACYKQLPKEHVPELLYIDNITPYYIEGLFQQTEFPTTD